MRKSDYALKTWLRETSGKNGNGKWAGSERIEFETMEQLDPDSLPATSSHSMRSSMPPNRARPSSGGRRQVLEAGVK